MSSSAEISILFKISELARRYGMRPSEADAYLEFICDDDTEDMGHYKLSFMGMTTATQEKFEELSRALGCNENGDLMTESLSEMEDVVEQASLLAPRVRRQHLR